MTFINIFFVFIASLAMLGAVAFLSKMIYKAWNALLKTADRRKSIYELRH